MDLASSDAHGCGTDTVPDEGLRSEIQQGGLFDILSLHGTQTDDAQQYIC